MSPALMDGALPGVEPCRRHDRPRFRPGRRRAIAASLRRLPADMRWPSWRGWPRGGRRAPGARGGSGLRSDGGREGSALHTTARPGVDRRDRRVHGRRARRAIPRGRGCRDILLPDRAMTSPTLGNDAVRRAGNRSSDAHRSSIQRSGASAGTPGECAIAPDRGVARHRRPARRTAVPRRPGRGQDPRNSRDLPFAGTRVEHRGRVRRPPGPGVRSVSFAVGAYLRRSSPAVSG